MLRTDSNLLSSRSCGPDIFRHIELLKVLGEARGKISRSFVVSRLVFPCVPRMQEFCRNSGAALRDSQSKRRIGLKLHVIELALNSCIHHCPGVSQLHARTHSIRSTEPSRVHQPALSAVLLHAAAQHLGVNLGTQ